ncbi:hypothetical protein D3C75_1333590 [compost metagenome]
MQHAGNPAEQPRGVSHRLSVEIERRKLLADRLLSKLYLKRPLAQPVTPGFALRTQVDICRAALAL